MPTPSPETGTEYIEIADFSPGIHSDQHGSLAPRHTASDTMKGALLGNGLARPDGTARCRADKTGALVPLPRAQATGPRDTRFPFVTTQPARPYRYLLDAQVGNTLVDATETAAVGFNFEPRFPVQMMWGQIHEVSGAFQILVIGREYRHHVDFQGFTDAVQPAIDFLLAITESFDAATTDAKLPIGSLVKARFYYGFTSAAMAAQAFTVVAANDTFTSTGHGYADGTAVVLSSLVGATGVTAGPTYYVRDSTVNTFKLAATVGGAAINITADGSGNVARTGTPPYTPLWAYPVSVALAATPFHRWGSHNYWMNGTFTTTNGAALHGLITDVNNPTTRWSPAIGLKGEGTCVIGMQLNDVPILNLPFPTAIDRWYFHYSERGNVPQNNLLDDVAGGPINPYMLIAHQGRIVMPDRRRTKGGRASTSLGIDAGYANDLLFYSDVQLPTQDTAVTPLTTDRGVANAAYGEFPQTTQERYNTLEVAMDSVSDVGAIGVVTVDQLLVVKHFGGGAVIQGDLDVPTVHRVPYIEPTSGLICKGALTPIGFVYGSPRGIFVWNGGDTTQVLSPQLDGFFWNHANTALNGPIDEEQYAGSRGRMAYWNGLICVPNNYVFDIETQAWWRLGVQTLAPVTNDAAPYNCYDVDETGVMFAFPYRYKAPFEESTVTFPNNSTGLNCLSIPDNASFSGITQLDLRYVVGCTLDDTLNTNKTFASHWQTTGDQRAFAFGIDASDTPYLLTSTAGTAGTVVTATSTQAIPIIQPIGVRVTWRSSDGRVQFFTKDLGQPIRAALRADTGWVQLGTDRVGATAALHNSTEDLVIGNLGNNALSEPLEGSLDGLGYPARFYGLWLATTIDGTAVVEVMPDDIPAEPAASFVCETGQTVTVTRAGAGSTLALAPAVTPPPVWYTFEQDDLDTTYTWQSHPLLQTRGRIKSFQSIELLATGLTWSGGSATTIAVELTGIGENGTAAAPVTTTFTLANTDQPQLLRKDIASNFQAEYVTVKITATGGGTTQVPAPKIHRILLATKDRARTPRHG